MNQSTRKKKCNHKLSAHHVFVCSVCHKIQTSILEMRQHIKSHKTFQCEVCLQTFKGKQVLKSHFKTHHEKSEFSCPLCKKSFLHIRYLEQHVKIHNTIKQFVCEVCGKQFTQLVHLKSHAATHMIRKPFPCKFCKKEFSCKGSLLRHCQVHTKKNLYVCNVCNKSFSRKDSLVVHVQVIHELKRNHKCAECNLEFSQKAYLKSHQEKVHTKNEVHEAKISNGPANIYILKKEEKPEIKVTFTVSILKKVSTECCESKGEVQNAELSSPSITTNASVNQDEEFLSLGATDVCATEIETSDVISEHEDSSLAPDFLTKEIPSVVLPCEGDTRESFHKRDKNCSDSLALFSDSDVCEILEPEPPSLGTDFLLDSLDDWENECRLGSEVLPICSMDHELVLEPSHELCNRDFLNIVSSDYFASLQCSMPFSDKLSDC